MSNQILVMIFRFRINPFSINPSTINPSALGVPKKAGTAHVKACQFLLFH